MKMENIIVNKLQEMYNNKRIAFIGKRHTDDFFIQECYFEKELGLKYDQSQPLSGYWSYGHIHTRSIIRTDWTGTGDEAFNGSLGINSIIHIPLSYNDIMLLPKHRSGIDPRIFDAQGFSNTPYTEQEQVNLYNLFIMMNNFDQVYHTLLYPGDHNPKKYRMIDAGMNILNIKMKMAAEEINNILF